MKLLSKFLLCFSMTVSVCAVAIDDLDDIAQECEQVIRFDSQKEQEEILKKTLKKQRERNCLYRLDSTLYLNNKKIDSYTVEVRDEKEFEDALSNQNIRFANHPKILAQEGKYTLKEILKPSIISLEDGSIKTGEEIEFIIYFPLDINTEEDLDKFVEVLDKLLSFFGFTL